MESFRIFLDTDVLINWLAKEINPNTGFNLWRYEIIELMEGGQIEGHTSLTNIFEIRFVLRRKKKYSEKKINDCIETLFGAIEIEIPDSGDMLEANRLQSEQPLDPFDSIGLGIILVKSAILVSRDDEFIKLAKKLNVEAYTPEEFLERYDKNKNITFTVLPGSNIDVGVGDKVEVLGTLGPDYQISAEKMIVSKRWKHEFVYIRSFIALIFLVFVFMRNWKFNIKRMEFVRSG